MKKKTIISLLLPTLLLTGCAVPLIIGGGAVATVPFRKKGVSGTINDMSLITSVDAKLYEYDAKAFTQIDTDVYNGEVLLTGLVENPSISSKAEELAWTVEGVRAVYNHIQPSKNSLLDYTKDTWITTKIKSKFLTDRDIKNLNYSVKTLAGVVYILGTAETQVELEKVHSVAGETTGVSKVISYVSLKGKES
jgi:osmotically-inducible protein OsmY